MKNVATRSVIARHKEPLMVVVPWVTLAAIGAYLPVPATATVEATKTPQMIVVPEFAVSQAKPVNLSALANIKVGGLISGYLGQKNQRDAKGNVLPVIIPASASINFADNLSRLWDRKLKIANVSGATRNNADKIVLRYTNSFPDTKSATSFVAEIDGIAIGSHKAIDYAALCGNLHIAPVQCQALRQVSGKIRGQHLAAYGMTELFPSQNGEFNYTLLDTLLKNAGENYIQSIPALGDTLLSVGFYQFTSYAVRHDATNVEGASVVSKVSSEKIPGSVMALEGSQHHQAAYYFAVYNMARLVQKLSVKDAHTFAGCNMGGVTQFMATAHHMPTRAISNAQSWIAGGCTKPFRAYTSAHLKEYATKTVNNLVALEDHV